MRALLIQLPTRGCRRTETFKLSTDPLFIDKVRDIVGLYIESAGKCGGIER